MRDLIKALRESDEKCAHCDKTAIKSQDGKPVCKGHSKGSGGC